MLELTISDKTYNIPSEWSELTMRQFIDAMILQKDSGNSDTDIFVKTLAIFSGEPGIEDALFSIDLEEFKEIQSHFTWISKEPEKPEHAKDFFIIDGKKFSMKKDYKNLTVGEAITVETLMRDKSFDIDPLEISFAVLFREVMPDGTLKPFNADTMFELLNKYSNEVKIIDVYEVISFFLSSDTSSSIKNSKVSLRIVKK